ncbi:flippase [Anaerocolumna cellulosilytica]|uniref:Flippase n=1 Tax=Anaerocolumna cellulosilytica TaxID=433286 RepID=A0A6S6R2Z9_9FIRM|nr:oligosaccharide flippase family protein [Anaerocolumna cellulosilytica]MBB5194463.1 O-antigen/teichoic acid export membrane protein [Anaerocolumna cellulosilytica]BCJ93408.1 flippase [Anaerocolumna cellulosilytica]
MSEDKRNQKLIKNTAILSVGTICTKGLMFLMTPLFTRWLSQEGYGTFDLLLTYVTLLMPLFTLDSNEAVFRFLLDTDEDKKRKKIISTASFLNLTGLLISFIAISVIALLRTEIRGILIYFYILLVAETFYTITTRIVRGIKKIPIYAICSLLFVIAMAVSSFILIQILQMGLQGIILGYTIGYVFCTVIMLVVSRAYAYISISGFDFSLLKDMLRYSIPLLPAEISWWIVNVSGRTIISIFLGTSYNAIYAVANKFPNLCQTLFSVFHLSWQENVVETFQDQDRDVYYSYIFNGIITILSSICMVIISMNFLIYEKLFQQEYFTGYYITPLLVASVLFSMLSQFLGSIYLAQFNTKKSGGSAAVAAVVNIIIHLALIKGIGLYAAAISTAVSYFSLFLVRYFDVVKKVRLVICNKTKICLILLVYFVAANYIYISWFNWINVLVAVIIFFLINKEIVTTYWTKKYKLKKLKFNLYR